MRFNNLGPRQIFLLLSLLVLFGALVLVSESDSPSPSASLTAEAGSSLAPTLNERVSQLETRVQQLEDQLQLGGEKTILSEEEQRIKVVKETLPSVVSIVASKKVQVYSSWFGWPGFSSESPTEEEQEVSSGTGFLISAEGMILTNKHVVSDEEATYTIITNDQQEYPAEVLARDPFQDLALVKIEGSGFRPVILGDSSKIILGESVISIGNALGEFQNTVSTGVISGLSRQINASGEGKVEALSNVIQTDAAINPGNSGGPLLNLRGEVIGINVAMAQSAENIAFSIPINQAKKAIEQVETLGKIVYPFLGIRYRTVDQFLQQQLGLEVDYGALLIRGESQGEPAVESGSAAERMGLKENDIILKMNGQKIDTDHLLGDLIKEYQPGDRINLEVLRQSRHLRLSGQLGKRES